jgi:hypothetical protein
VYKCLLPRLDIYVDASLHGLGGALGSFCYRLALPHKPGWCIAYWEAINIFLALQVFASHIAGQRVTVWSDSLVAVSVLQAGRGADPVLHTIARNIWLLQATLDCDLQVSHIPGRLNGVADLLSRWSSAPHPDSSLAAHMGRAPQWCPVSSALLTLDHSI